MNKQLQLIMDAFNRDKHMGMIIHYNDRFLGLVRLHVFRDTQVMINWGTGEVIFSKGLLRYEIDGHTSSFTNFDIKIKQSQLCKKQPWL